MATSITYVVGATPQAEFSIPFANTARAADFAVKVGGVPTTAFDVNETGTTLTLVTPAQNVNVEIQLDIEVRRVSVIPTVGKVDMAIIGRELDRIYLIMKQMGLSTVESFFYDQFTNFLNTNPTTVDTIKDAVKDQVIVELPSMGDIDAALQDVLDATAYARSIKTILPVGALPTTAEVGDLVVLTTDDKLYRCTNAGPPAVWTPVVADVTGEIDAAMIVAIPAAKITGQLTDSQLAAIAAAKIAGQLTDAQIAAIAAAKLQGTISGTQVGAGAITTPKLAANAVTANEIVAAAVTAAKIVTEAVTATKIGAAAVEAAKVAAGAIVTEKLASDAVTTAKLAAGSVDAAAVATGAVSAVKIAALAVTSAKVAASAITSDELASNAVIAGRIAAGAVNSSQIASDAIISSKMGAGAITAVNAALANLAVVRAKMADAAVGRIQIGDNSISQIGYAFNAAEFDPNEDVWQDVLSLTITRSPGTILLMLASCSWSGGASSGPNVTFRLVRGGTVKTTFQGESADSGGYAMKMWFDGNLDVDGTYTYRFQSWVDSGMPNGFRLSDRGFYCLELSR